MGISAHEVTLDQLAHEIAEVYERCGFDADATVSTLQMLTNIEVSLCRHSTYIHYNLSFNYAIPPLLYALYCGHIICSGFVVSACNHTHVLHAMFELVATIIGLC